MIKAVLFDLDGVLVDMPEGHYEALNKTLSLFGTKINRDEHASVFNGLPTRKKVEKLIEIGLGHGFQREIDWIEEMSSWFVEWFAFLGLAEITTPVGVIYSATDATAEMYRVTYRGAEKLEE